MATTKDKAVDKLTMGNAVIAQGDKIAVPVGVTLRQAIDVLAREMQYQEQPVGINEEIPGTLYDAARAFYLALCRKYGWTVSKPGFLGDPPQTFNVPDSVSTTTAVPWGSFTVPGVAGTFQFGTKQGKDGRVAFALHATVLRKDTDKVHELIALARKIQKEESLYRGKAVRIEFTDEYGDNVEMIEPSFIDVSKVSEESLILSTPVANAVSTSVFTPIKYAAVCKANGIPTKRGVLFSGKYGTGKTLASTVAAKLCTEAGRTFIYVPKAADLADAICFAQDYAPAMLFVEDIDRAMGGARTADVDAILNVIDGVDTKSSDVMIVLTTNDVSAINRAMIRPGRLDDVIEFLPPDADAVKRLIQLYAGSLLQKDADLDYVSSTLAGQIPAVIREAVERAKLSQIKLSAGKGALSIGADALADAVDTMRTHLELLDTTPKGLSAVHAFGELLHIISNPNGVNAKDLTVSFAHNAAMLKEKPKQARR